MSDAARQDAGRTGGRGGVTLAAAALVVLLAAAALLWPAAPADRGSPFLLVLDPSGEDVRTSGVYGVLGEFLADRCSRELRVVRVGDLAAFRRELAAGPVLVLAPDGAALEVDPAAYLPVAVGRRAAPMNLRPRGVVVSRRSTADVAAPWRTVPERTVAGDSLSLAATGALRADGLDSWPRGLACGPDPYDHGPALHALRLGAYDHALVREWDAVRFFAAGLLADDEFVAREVVAHVPDLVLMVSREVPRHVRAKCGEALAAVGREPDEEAPGDRALRRDLAQLRLDGFNMLLEPDFEQVRRKFAGNWLPAQD